MNRMPRSSPSMPERKITTMPLIVDRTKNLPAIISQKPSFLQTMKEGFALGIGSSLGHKLVDTVTRPVEKEPMSNVLKEFEKCMTKYDDKEMCERVLANK